MSMVILRTADELLVHGIHDPPLDFHDDGLVALVAHHDALQYALRHLRLSLRPLGDGRLAERAAYTGDVPAHLTDARGVLQLARRLLEAQVELLLPQVGDRKSVGAGKSVYVRVDLGGRRIIKKKKTKTSIT